MRTLDSAPVAFAVATLAAPAPDMTALHAAALRTLAALDARAACEATSDALTDALASWVNVAPRSVRTPRAFL